MIENIKKAARLLKEANTILERGPLEFYLTELVGAYEFLMEFAPFKIGELVKLKITPEINLTNAGGWMPYKHLLVKGKVGTVRSSKCSKNGFAFEVDFGSKDEPMLFLFKAEFLEKE